MGSFCRIGSGEGRVLNQPVRLRGISPCSYVHPTDRATAAALRPIPYVESLLPQLTDLGLERSHRQGLVASGIRIGPYQLPQLPP